MGAARLTHVVDDVAREAKGQKESKIHKRLCSQWKTRDAVEINAWSDR